MSETIKAISINQPFASLILNPPHLKRVENRTWRTDYRGDLLIHAARGRDWLKGWDDALPDPMPFGAIIGVVRLVGCVHIQTVREGRAPGSVSWVLDHEYASGPYCWVLENARQFAEPVPYRGLLKVFDVPRAAVEQQLQHVGASL